MVKLLIARHGNTFDKGEIVKRVGSKTDLPLSNSGKKQAQQLGCYLQANHPEVSAVFTSQLKRTQQTASIALTTMNSTVIPSPNSLFNEINYGVCDGLPESEVINIVGSIALTAWDQDAILPEAWSFDVIDFQRSWQKFIQSLQRNFINQTVLVITSNGIIRFMVQTLTDFNEFKQRYSLKMATGAISCFVYDKRWQLGYWNRR